VPDTIRVMDPVSDTVRCQGQLVPRVRLSIWCLTPVLSRC